MADTGDCHPHAPGRDPMVDRWNDVDQLFQAALDLPDEDRAAFVAREAGEDGTLAEAVGRLLRAEAASEGLFDGPRAVRSRAFLDDLATRGHAAPAAEGYEILREVGRGGMGTVYLARRTGEGFEQQVALKVLRRGVDTDDVLRRFAIERRILASLHHPNIARLYDGGTTADGRPFLAMEYVEGTPLTAYCDARKLPIRQRLELLLPVTDAVRSAHAALVVHRDLKPSNILVTTDGHAKLLDFGIAKLLGPDYETEHTRTGLYLLTPDHASPEQLRGEPVTTATDVYQLGVLLYRLLTGQPPCRATTPPAAGGVEALTRFLDLPRPSTIVDAGPESGPIADARGTTPAQLRRMLSGDLDTIVGKALRHDPARRYVSVEELAGDIRRYLDGRAISARPDTRGYRARLFLRRHPWVAPVAAAALFFLGVYVATLVLHARSLETERNAAQQQAERAQEVQRFLTDLFASADPYRPADPALGRRITVVEALDVGVERLQTSLTDRPAIRASILASISDVYQSLGMFDRALPLREEAQTLQTALYGPTSREARDDLSALASIHSELGHPALDLYTKRLDLALSADPVDVAEVADARIMRGRHLMSLNRPADAEPEFRAIVELAEDGGVPPESIAETWRGLADALRETERYEESEVAGRRAIALTDEALGPDTAAAGFGRGTLAQTLGLLGKIDEAERYFQEALDRLVPALGQDHKYVRATMGNLAVLRINAGNPEGAVTLLRQLVESGERLNGKDHPALGGDLQNLATALVGVGRLDEARRVYARVADLNRRWLEEDDYQRALPLLSLSGIELMQHRPAEAERDARAALDTLEKALPAGHFITAVADCRVARALVLQGRPAAAAPYFVRATPPLIETRSVPDYRRDCLTWAADFHEARGEAAEAARLRAVLAGSGS